MRSEVTRDERGTQKETTMFTTICIATVIISSILASYVVLSMRMGDGCDDK